MDAAKTEGDEANQISESYEVRVPAHSDGGGRVPDLTVREARDRWLNKLRVSKTDSTVSSYHYRTKHFVEWCERQGIDEIADLTGWDIESFETYRRSEGLAAITLNKEIGTLKNFLEYCARAELVGGDLPEKVNPPEVSRDEHVDEKMLHPDAALQLLQHYRQDPEIRHTRAHALLEVAWATGARLSGLRGLDVDDYDTDKELVRFFHRPESGTPLKNGREGERFVGLPSQVCDAVDGYLKHDRMEKYDDHGRAPLFASQTGRASQNAVRAWMYLATVPCLHSDCPHGNVRETCDYVDYSHASKCPSSRSPHQVRTGSITWQRNRGVPPEVVAERVNSSVRVIEQHYDVATKREEMEARRRQHIDRLSIDEEGDAE